MTASNENILAIINEVKLALGDLQTRMKYVESTISKVDLRLESQYVTHDQFQPVKQVVFGLISLVLVSVVGALMAILLK